MKTSFVSKVQKLYGSQWRLYGPYLWKDKRRRVILCNGQIRKLRQYAKLKLEVKLGRLLKKGEEVDHIDGNTLNDRYSNLQVLSSKENRLKAVLDKWGPKKKFNCAYCEKVLIISSSRKFGDKKFCTNSCRSRFYFKGFGKIVRPKNPGRKRKFTFADKENMILLRNKGIDRSEIAKQYKTHPTTISKILSGKIKTAP